MRWWEFAWNKAIAPRNDLFQEFLRNEASKELERWWGIHSFEPRCEGKPLTGNSAVSEDKRKGCFGKKSSKPLASRENQAKLWYPKKFTFRRNLPDIKPVARVYQIG